MGDTFTLTDEIIRFMSQYSLESILSGIIEMQMLLYGRDDMFIPAAEYLAANALYACSIEGTKEFKWADYQILEQYGKRAYTPNVEKLIAETLQMVNANDTEKQEFLQSQMMKMKGNMCRGDGYIHQLVAVARDLYVPLDSSMKATMGFSFSSYEKVIRYIFAQYEKRICRAYKEKNKITTVIKAIRNKEQPWVPSIKSGYIFRIYKSELKQIIGDESEKMCGYLCLKADDDLFKKVEYDEFKMLQSKPFVDFGDYIYMPLIFSTLMNLPKQFHYSFIAEKLFDKETLGIYTKNRGNVVERLTSKFVSRLIPEDKIFHNLSYFGEDGEADVTVVAEAGMLFGECKSKIITLNSIRGIHESIKSDVYQAIGAAYSQGVRSIQRVVEGKKFITESGEEVVIPNVGKKYVVCVTIENFGIIPSEIDDYISIEENVGVPYVVNVYDFDIITQECNSYSELIDYIEFRRNNHKIISTMDELDAFGFFKKHGNKTIALSADEFHITNYTAKFDMKYRLKDREVFSEFTRG